MTEQVVDVTELPEDKTPLPWKKIAIGAATGVAAAVAAVFLFSHSTDEPAPEDEEDETPAEA